MMRKLSLLLFLGVLLIAVILSFTSCDTGSNNTSNEKSGNITIKYSTPGLGKNDDGYIEATGTLVVKDGNMDSYDLTMKSTYKKYTGELTHGGYRYKIARTETRSADGLYAGIAECMVEYQNFVLDSIDSDVPDFDENENSYDKIKIDFDWEENGISSIKYYDWNSQSNDFESNPYYVEKYEYYDNGKLKDIRYSSEENEGGSNYFYLADWYKLYDSTFTNYPTEIWNFHAYYSQEDDSIPDNYDYDKNDKGYDSEQDTSYTYTSDENGRIGTTEVKTWDSNSNDWQNDYKMEITYDSSGNLSTIKQYLWNSDNNSYENTPYIQFDFTVPSGLSFTLDDVFFEPGQSMLFGF